MLFKEKEHVCFSKDGKSPKFQHVIHSLCCTANLKKGFHIQRSLHSIFASIFMHLKSCFFFPLELELYSEHTCVYEPLVKPFKINKHSTSSSPCCIERQHSLHCHIGERNVETLKHHLHHALPVLQGVHGCFSQQDGMVFRIHKQLLESVIPNLKRKLSVKVMSSSKTAEKENYKRSVAAALLNFKE